MIIWKKDLGFSHTGREVILIQSTNGTITLHLQENHLCYPTVFTVDDVEKDMVDDSFYMDEHSGDVLDNSSIIVGTINIFMDGFWEVVAREVVSFDKSPMKSVD